MHILAALRAFFSRSLFLWVFHVSQRSLALSLKEASYKLAQDPPISSSESDSQGHIFFEMRREGPAELDPHTLLFQRTRQSWFNSFILYISNLLVCVAITFLSLDFFLQGTCLCLGESFDEDIP